jgi:hypothetical protein
MTGELMKDKSIPTLNLKHVCIGLLIKIDALKNKFVRCEGAVLIECVISEIRTRNQGIDKHVTGSM